MPAHAACQQALGGMGVTIFKSLGFAIKDLVAAQLAQARAQEGNVGRVLEL